jgi:glutamate-1-semialdehyde aminotransferase
MPVPARTATLCRRINEVFEEEHVPWAAYRMFSNFHIFTNPDHRTIVPTRFDPLEQPAEALAGNRQAGVVHKLRLAMMAGGIDFSGSPGGIVSATHAEPELEDTVNALRNTVRLLKQEGEI